MAAPTVSDVAPGLRTYAGGVSRAGFRFVPNPEGIALLERGPAALAAVSRAAEAGIDEAAAIAPERTGAYKRGLKAQAGVDGGKVRGRMNATDFKSGWIELGTSDTPTFAVLRRACDAAGLSLGFNPVI